MSVNDQATQLALGIRESGADTVATTGINMGQRRRRKAGTRRRKKLFNT